MSYYLCHKTLNLTQTQIKGINPLLQDRKSKLIGGVGFLEIPALNLILKVWPKCSSYVKRNVRGNYKRPVLCLLAVPFNCSRD